MYRTLLYIAAPVAKIYFCNSVCSTSSQRNVCALKQTVSLTTFCTHPPTPSQMHSLGAPWKEGHARLNGRNNSGGALCCEVAFFLLAMHKSPCVFVYYWLIEPASLHCVANDAVPSVNASKPLHHLRLTRPDYQAQTSLIAIASIRGYPWHA
jgi:hypothetical protein